MKKPDTALNAQVKLPIVTSMNLKKQLRFYLDLHELSAAQLARKSNVPKQSLSGWLAGSNPRDVRQVKKVADALGITLDNLMFGSGTDESSQRNADLSSLLGDEWIGGVFEVKFRRVKGKA